MTTKFINNDNFIASSTASGGLTESDSDRTEDQKKVLIFLCRQAVFPVAAMHIFFFLYMNYRFMYIIFSLSLKHLFYGMQKLYLYLPMLWKPKFG